MLCASAVGSAPSPVSVGPWKTKPSLWQQMVERACWELGRERARQRGARHFSAARCSYRLSEESAASIRAAPGFQAEAAPPGPDCATLACFQGQVSRSPPTLHSGAEGRSDPWLKASGDHLPGKGSCQGFQKDLPQKELGRVSGSKGTRIGSLLSCRKRPLCKL